MTRISTRIAAVFAALLLSGCYSYGPIASPQAPRGGQQVRVQLTDEGVLQAAEKLGPGVWSLEGQVLRFRPDSITLAVTNVKTRNRGEMFWNGEALTLSSVSVQALEGRRFSRWRTAVVVGLSALAAYLVSSGDLSTDRPVETPPGTPEPPGSQT